MGRSRNERRAISVGITGTLLLHVLLLWMAPRLDRMMLGDPSEQRTGSDDTARQFEIELMSEEVPEPVEPNRFVEVNPDAPDNPPDETINFGARNQQLAQEEPDLENRSDMPSTEGRDDFESTAIVSGNRMPPMVAIEVPPAPENEIEPNDFVDPAEAPRLAQDPISGQEQIHGENPEGVGSNIVRLPENPQADVDEAIEGIRDPNLARPDGRGLYFRPDPSRPQPRPALSQSQIRPTIMANRVAGTANVGVRAHNALRTTYGDYLQRVIDVVDAEWTRAIITRNSRGFAFPSSGSTVEVTFFIKKDGKVTIGKVNGNAGQFWDGVAVEAIAAPARQSEGFGKWPDDMIAILGDETELVFTFHYM
jgi:hypothetical protein